MIYVDAKVEKYLKAKPLERTSLMQVIEQTASKTFGAAVRRDSIVRIFGVPESLISEDDVRIVREFAVRAGRDYFEARIFGARSLSGHSPLEDYEDEVIDIESYSVTQAEHDLGHILWKFMS